MSWFSEIASKAEAMLVRLDQDAAQALQDPDVISRGTKILDKAINTISGANTTDEQSDQQPLVPEIPETNDHVQSEVSSTPGRLSRTADAVQYTPIVPKDDDSFIDTEGLAQQHGEFEPELIRDPTPVPVAPANAEFTYHNAPFTLQSQEFVSTPESVSGNNQKSRSDSRQQTRKFKLQISKLQRPIVDKKNNFRSESGYPSANGVMEARVDDTTLATSPGADDIRASINRSLQEYSVSSSVNMYPGSSNGETAYSSHFDNQPNLVQISPSTEHGSSNDKRAGRSRNLNSFSIDLPNNPSSLNDSQPSSDIASRLIKQASKRKSTFSIHQVINRLASQNGHSGPLIGESTKLKFRRAQMRAASYARRLNYYLRAYPTMKYWIVLYIVIMQLLVVYVLFFYQSNTSYTYLSAQVKQQQEVLAENKESQ